jgi:hypothetical protein
VLREITIVDTPGTNSVVLNHQAITENYIPQSDLVLFVFPAKAPYTRTAWDLLALVQKEWHRKIVFILQQSDIASQNEVTIAIDRVKQYAHERGVQAPLVFTVSAKRESEGASDSGFSEFRQFLSKAVESGDVWRMKVESTRASIRTVLTRLLEGLRKEQIAIIEDKAFYQGLASKIESRREKANSLKRLVVDSLYAMYDRLCARLEKDFKEGLEVGNLLRRAIPIVRDKDMATWLKDLQSEFEKAASEQIETETKRTAKDLSDEMQAMFDDLTKELLRREERKNSSVPSLSGERLDFLEQTRARLNALRLSDIAGEKGFEGSNLGSLTLAGGGLTALGAVIAVATKLVIFDITGGVLAALGVTLVAITLPWKRSSVLQDFSGKLTKSREDFRGRLDHQITQMLDRIFLEVLHTVKEPLGLLEGRVKQIEESLKEAADLLDKI